MQHYLALRDRSIGLLDILNSFPSCHPPLDVLLEHLAPLQPRLYSIASSPLTDTKNVTFAFNVVCYKVEGMTRKGLCTPWIEAITNAPIEKGIPMSVHAELPAYPKPTLHFKLPLDPSAKVIMIGPGTGVTPFIGFLEHRSYSPNGGPMWLFYGCREEDKDYLFQKELSQFNEKGVLSRLDVVYSREREKSMGDRYVQHRVKRHGKDVYEWIQEGAYVYVCG